MIKHADHVTLAVSNLESAKQLFVLLGFEEEKSVLISGGKFSRYMGIDDIEAEHVTLVLTGAKPRFEIQLLHYHKPALHDDRNIERLDKLGYNHLCLAVDDIEKAVEGLKAKGVVFQNEIMEFNNKKLIFFTGPDGIILELSQALPVTA